MATLTLSNSFNGDWPPDTMGGGTITARSATAMTYISDQGYTITLRGTGLTFDADGLPSGGTIGRTTIAKDGLTVADFAGVSVDFTRTGMQIFGYDRDNGRHQDPDPYGFFQSMMRGNDSITGSAGDDDVRGGTGNDVINTGAGRDYVGGEAGDDTMNGGADGDTLSYDEANFRWDAFRGVNLDAVTGIAIDNWGNTDLFSSFDRFKDSAFSDTLKGSATDESFSVTRGNDVIDGRGGNDFVDYGDADRWGAHRGINVNLATGVAIDSWNGTDTLANIEGVFGTKFNDTITGGAGNDTLLGGDGTDVLNGGAGRDRLAFWNVGDNGSGHGIVIDLSQAVNILDDGYGHAETATDFEEIDGSRFDDRLTGDNLKNQFWGNEGNDTLNGGGAEDDVNGGDGDDRIFAGLGNDHIEGGRGNDTLTGNGGSDQFNFFAPLNEQGVDTITDFEVGIDNVWVDSAWGGGLTLDHLIANQFRSGAGVTSANSATQRVIYNSTTGDLFYDADGKGGAVAVLFAHLSNHAALTVDDFMVFV